MTPTARIPVTAEQVAEIQGIAEELRKHSTEVEAVLRSGIESRERAERLREMHRAFVDKATLMLVLVEAQAEAYEQDGRIDVAAMRHSARELRAWIEQQEVA